MKYQLKLSNQTIEIEICQTFLKRLLGFMFRKKKITTGKLFPHCHSIHTFFMFQKIDVIVCNQDMEIMNLKKEFPPNHILLPIQGASCILELPLGSIENLKIGDFISLEK